MYRNSTLGGSENCWELMLEILGIVRNKAGNSGNCWEQGWKFWELLGKRLRILGIVGNKAGNSGNYWEKG